MGRGRGRGRPGDRRLGSLEPGRPCGRMGTRRGGRVARRRALEPRPRRLPGPGGLRVRSRRSVGRRAHERRGGARGAVEALVAGPEPGRSRGCLVGGPRGAARAQSIGGLVDDRAPARLAMAGHCGDHGGAVRVDRMDLAHPAPRARRGRTGPGDARAPLDARDRGGARGPHGARSRRRHGEPGARARRDAAHGGRPSRRRRGRGPGRAPHRRARPRRRRRLGPRRVDGRERVLRRRVVRHAVHRRAGARHRVRIRHARGADAAGRGRLARRLRARGRRSRARRPAGGDPGDAPRPPSPGRRGRSFSRALDVRPHRGDDGGRGGLRSPARRRSAGNAAPRGCRRARSDTSRRGARRARGAAARPPAARSMDVRSRRRARHRRRATARRRGFSSCRGVSAPKR